MVCRPDRQAIELRPLFSLPAWPSATSGPCAIPGLIFAAPEFHALFSVEPTQWDTWRLMFKGTPGVKAGEFSRRVAALGGRENAFTSKDNTGYYQQIPANRLEDVMKLEADRFANNQWSDEEFAKEIEVVKEERRLRTEDSPRALMGEALAATVFVASPYRRPVVGWMSDLDAMTAADVREFYRRWYVPGNAAVVVAAARSMAASEGFIVGTGRTGLR